jgi:hypothetical protein
VIYPEQLNYIENDETRIIKLHGDIDHPSSLVLTRSDYAAYASRHTDFIQQLQVSINGFTVLFIGFGLRDPNFRRIFTDARSFYESTNRTAYAVMSGTNAVERDMWNREGLAILPVAQHRQVPARLNQLRALVNS